MTNNNAAISQTNRNYGIDLLRIISMLMVAILHVLGHGGVLASTKLFSPNYMIAWFLEIAAYCAVNCYALISGYVGYESKHKFSNLFQLLFQVMFYTLSITTIFAIAMPGTVDIKDFIKAAFPFAFNVYWYFTSYFCIFFFIPFLNILIKTLEKKQAKALVGTITFVFSILPLVFMRDIFNANGGYSPLWLAVIYLIGAYIKKYNIGNKLRKAKLLAIYFVCIIITWLSKIIIEITTIKLLDNSLGSNVLVSYTSPTILLASIALLILFSKMETKTAINKAIRIISPTAFSVYLIHVEPLVWEYVIKSRFESYAQYSFVIFPFIILGTALGIFVICSAIDLIRIKLFKIIKIRNLSISIETLITKSLHKLNQLWEHRT